MLLLVQDQLTAFFFASAATTPTGKAETTLIRTLTYKKEGDLNYKLIIVMFICKVNIVFRLQSVQFPS